MDYNVTKIFQGAPMVKLEKYIFQCSEKNIEKRYGVSELQGVTSDGVFDFSKAKTDGLKFDSYKIVYENDFAYNPSRINLGSIALRKGKPCIISPMYVVFRLNEEGVKYIIPEFLLLWFKRIEFQRSTLYFASGSVRDTFDFNQMQQVMVPMPSIEVQREYVAAYRSLQQLAEQNEALAAPLQDACFSHLAHIKTTFESVSLSDYIEQCSDKNSNNEYGVESLQGVTSESVFDTSKAKTEGLKFDSYKIVFENDFAYNPSRVNLGSIALRKGKPCIISPMYIVFRLTHKGIQHIIPEFLLLWFLRKEFLRSTIFYASGSVRDTFDFYEMQRVKIPLPPIEVQRSIVALYNCAEEARAIAKEAREQLKILAPAMVQRAANTPVEV